ncbi:MAG: hypothetical protein ACHQC8_02800 [Solirubrobacterales bacterium]
MHPGTAAGTEATLSSASIRGKMLEIMGHSNFAAPPEVRREACAWLTEAAVSGELTVDTEPIALERLAEAWRRVEAGWHRKIVFVP